MAGIFKTLTIFPAPTNDMLRGPNGAVFKHLIRVGDTLIALAVQQLEPHRRTGRLQDSIVKRFGEGPSMTVVAGAGLGTPNYAYWMHEGNAQEGDRIFPKNGPFLVWKGIDGRWNKRTSVRTFGGTKYLTDNLAIALSSPGGQISGVGF